MASFNKFNMRNKRDMREMRNKSNGVRVFVKGDDGRKFEVRRPELWKSRLCYNYMEGGYCKAGSGCTFAHGYNDLRGGVSRMGVNRGMVSGNVSGPTNVSKNVFDVLRGGESVKCESRVKESFPSLGEAVGNRVVREDARTVALRKRLEEERNARRRKDEGRREKEMEAHREREAARREEELKERDGMILLIREKPEWWKGKMCKFGKNCRKDRNVCAFAHDKEEMCLWRDLMGVLTREEEREKYEMEERDRRNREELKDWADSVKDSMGMGKMVVLSKKKLEEDWSKLSVPDISGAWGDYEESEGTDFDRWLEENPIDSESW